MTNLRVNLAAFLTLAAAASGIPLAVASATPGPPPPAYEVVVTPILPPITTRPVWTDTALLLSFEGPPPTAPEPEPEPEPERPADHPAPVALDSSVRGRALSTLAELGAPGWVINGFDCLARSESGWRNIRSDHANSNGTFDHGVWQINDVHWPRLNARGLDPYVPEDAATFVWTLWRESGFGPWSATRWGCGV
jgi:hypothetical protein